MAQTIYEFQVTVPAGTSQSAGWSQPLTIPPCQVQEIDIKVPPGPRGNMGFAIGTSGMPVIPYATGSWIVTDDEEISWPLENQLDSGGWEAFAYNLGSYPHTIYIRFLTSPLGSSAPSQPAPIAAADLAGDTSSPLAPPAPTAPALTQPALGVTATLEPPAFGGITLPPTPIITGPATQAPAAPAAQRSKEIPMVTVVPVGGQVAAVFVDPTGDLILSLSQRSDVTKEGRWTIGTNCQYPQAPGVYYDPAQNQVYVSVLTNDGNAWLIVFDVATQKYPSKQL